MSDIREVIKDKLLKRIRDVSEYNRIYGTVIEFREFAAALRIEAETKNTEAKTKLCEKEVTKNNG